MKPMIIDIHAHYTPTSLLLERFDAHAHRFPSVKLVRNDKGAALQFPGSEPRQIMPRLADLIIVDRLHPSLAANLNGDRFISDPETPIGDDDRVLILSADAGG